MYDKDRGELLYSPQRGHYYENDDKNRKKSIIIVVLVLLFSALSGYVAYKFTQKTPTIIYKIIKPKEPKVVKEVEPKIKEVSTPIIDKNISKKIEIPTIKDPIIIKKEKINNTDKKSKEINNSQEPIFNRGDNSTFFTSMGKSVDGAKIEQNIQKVKLKAIDTQKIKKELTKQKNNPIKRKKISTIKVKQGDTIYRIAKKVYGDSRKYKKILKENGITKPSSLKIGQILRIPND